MNLYGVDSTIFSTPVLLIDWTAESYCSYKIQTLIGWGDASADFELLINDIPVAGGRSSDQSRTVQVWWDGAIMVNPGDTVSVLATHYSQGFLALKCNLILNRI